MSRDLELAEAILNSAVRNERPELLTQNDCLVIQEELARLRALIPLARVLDGPDVDPAQAARMAEPHRTLMECVGDFTMLMPSAAARVPADTDGFWAAHDATMRAWAAADRLAAAAHEFGDQLMQRCFDLLKTRCAQSIAEAKRLRKEVPVA